MGKLIIIFFMIFSFINPAKSYQGKSLYDLSFKSINGETIQMDKYKNNVLIVVNVASRCGYTPQYEDLQFVWEKYRENNLIILGIPTNNFKQEPGTNEEIKNFCETNFGIDFPMTEKIDVIGTNAHPFYKWAKNNYGLGAIPKWNFHKIVIGKDGKIVDTFASFTKPTSKKFINLIEKRN